MALIMERLVLDHAVGRGCKNTRADVLRVQFALNSMASSWGGPKAALPFDGRYDNRLMTAIQGFQVHCFSNIKKASGKIEPGDRTHGKINQVLDGAVDIVAVTSYGGNAIEIGAKAFGTEIRFDGLTELVARVNAALADKSADASFAGKPKKLGHLSISSHGAPGYMRLTTAKLADATVNNNLILAQMWFKDMVNFQPDELLAEQADYLASFKGQFVRGGLITLSACRVAASWRQEDKKTKQVKFDIDGRNFLKAVSKAVGNVAVQGGVVTQNDVDFGMEGPCWRCDSHVCMQITPKSTSFFGPDFSVADEFGQHHLEDVAAEEAALAKVENVPPSHPDKQKLLKKLFNRKRRS